MEEGSEENDDDGSDQIDEGGSEQNVKPGFLRPTTSCNMAAIIHLIPSLGLQRTNLILDIHVMVN